jgi:hypothetical protein
MGDEQAPFLGEDNFPKPFLLVGTEITEGERKNVRVIERVMQEFWFKGETQKAPEFFAKDGWRYDPFIPSIHGPQAYGDLVQQYHKAFKFEKFDLQLVITGRTAADAGAAAGEGEWIAWRTLVTGTHVGPFEGIPGTGAKFRVLTHSFIRFNEEHKAFEGWIVTDYLSMFIDIFFGLSWLKRILYAPRLYKTMLQMKKNLDRAPTDPPGSIDRPRGPRSPRAQPWY